MYIIVSIQKIFYVYKHLLQMNKRIVDGRNTKQKQYTAQAIFRLCKSEHLHFEPQRKCFTEHCFCY